ncbi:MAG TPA: YdeI/OmpD-associated family protein [Chlorobiota bacterium]|nr:YdeI/OmpD-associated family protein [Chlorobiota bacterium]
MKAQKPQSQSTTSSKPTPDQLFERARRWKEELLVLREILKQTDMTEDVKWYQPVYTVNGKNVCILSTFKDSCVLGFFKGALLQDPENNLRQPGPNTQSSRFLRFTSVNEIRQQETAIRRYVDEAIAHERSGTKVVFQRIDERPLPEELVQAFQRIPELEQSFRALTPGRQREYLLHFSSAKQSATRHSRIEACMQRILDGKGFREK